MKWLTLDLIKAQLRMEPDFTLEDSLLELYGKSAEEAVLNLCGRTYEEFVEKYGSIPSAIIEVSLMLVELSYDQRSPLSSQNLHLIPYAFDLKIKKYIKLT